MSTQKTPRIASRVPKARAKASTEWLTNSSVLVHAIRALCTRTGVSVLELHRDKRHAEIEIARGAISSARIGRLGGQDAFNHLLMWSDVTFKVRTIASSARASIGARSDTVIDLGLAFVSQLDGVAHTIGGPRCRLSWNAVRLAELASTLPPPVRAFAAGLADNTPLCDLVEASTFAASDALKISYRLCELGVFVMHPPAEEAPSLASQIALIDWVLDTKKVVASKPARRDATAETTTRRPKLSATQRLARTPSVPIPRGELSFDDLDRAFFAREIELHVEEPVDQFEDLEDTATRDKISRQRRKI